MATTKITIKLLVDTHANKVLFAEASKDFVDFLFYLLALPIGAVIKLLTSESMVGSIGNLYTSFANLTETYLQPNLNKNVLLDPKFSTSVTNIPLLVTESPTISNKKFYICAKYPNSCSNAITDTYNAVPCAYCKNLLSKELIFVGGSNTSGTVANTNAKKETDGFVQKIVSYMISDDLSVKSMSMISSISIIVKFNVAKLDMLEEREVEVDIEKGLELLKASLQSTTVLTDVFLGRSKVKPSI